MSFSVFGYPVHIQGAFWFTAILLGLLRFNFSVAGTNMPNLVLWVLVVLSGITVHELGHAVMMRRFRLQPDIVLHGLGGYTTAPGLGGLKRLQHVIVSAAGPLAGILFGLLWWGMEMALADWVLTLGPKGRDIIWNTFRSLHWVNFGWSILNLLPLLPLDGGHILEHALGPKRIKITLGVSMAIGAVLVTFAALRGLIFITMLLGYLTYLSYRRLQAEREAAPAPRKKPSTPPPEPIPREVLTQLQEAKKALAEDRNEEAGTIAELILSSSPPKEARQEALTILGWAHLLEERTGEAAKVVKALRRQGEPDPALAGAVLLQQGDKSEARSVFEEARADGDDRKEIVGPLIQILIEQNEVARAAAIALDIVETLSDEDVRQMAEIAADAEAHSWSSRLFEALFERSGAPDDAYEAARHRGLDGDPSGALLLLRKAVGAGFSDATRVWSDKALETVRQSEEASELEEMLPRPGR